MQKFFLLLVVVVIGMGFGLFVVVQKYNEEYDRNCVNMRALAESKEKLLRVSLEFEGLRDKYSSSLEQIRSLSDKILDLNSKLSGLNNIIGDKDRELSELSKLSSEQERVESLVESKADNKNSGLIVCPFCDGDYSSHWVACRRSGGVGCDGHGYRPCFECSGKTKLPCIRCNGSGKITIGSSSGSGAWKKNGSNTRVCEVCSGDGRIDCTVCSDIYVRLPLNSGNTFLEPIISQGKPLGDSTLVISGCLIRVDTYYGLWKKVTGQAVCPKCTGRGKIRDKGKCDKCNDGKIERAKVLPVE